MHPLIPRTAALFGVSSRDLTGRCRRRHVVHARQAAIWAMLQTTDLSLAAVGREFGGRDHTTVMYARDEAEARGATDPAYREKLELLLATPDRGTPHPGDVPRAMRALTLSRVERGHLFWSNQAFGWFPRALAA
jgi:hypothetical protein